MWLQVCPPSVDRAKTIGSGLNVLLLPNRPAPMKSVQLAYTFPKNGLFGFASAQM